MVRNLCDGLVKHLDMSQKAFDGLDAAEKLECLRFEFGNIFQQLIDRHEASQNNNTKSRITKDLGLNTFELIEYIRAAIEIQFISKNQQRKFQKQEHSIIQPIDSIHSSFSQPPCPQLYEKIIQDLENDVRKHIRVEQQLKLHVESLEDTIESLEIDCVKFQGAIENQNKQISKLSLEHQKNITDLKSYYEMCEKLKTNETALQAQLALLLKQKSGCQKLVIMQPEADINIGRPYKKSGVFKIDRKTPDSTSNNQLNTRSELNFYKEISPSMYRNIKSILPSNAVRQRATVINNQNKFSTLQDPLQSLNNSANTISGDQTLKNWRRSSSKKKKHSHSPTRQKNQKLIDESLNSKELSQFSQIITNNISGLPINYSNQILEIPQATGMQSHIVPFNSQYNEEIDRRCRSSSPANKKTTKKSMNEPKERPRSKRISADKSQFNNSYTHKGADPALRSRNFIVKLGPKPMKINRQPTQTVVQNAYATFQTNFTVNLKSQHSIPTFATQKYSNQNSKMSRENSLQNTIKKAVVVKKFSVLPEKHVKLESAIFHQNTAAADALMRSRSPLGMPQND